MDIFRRRFLIFFFFFAPFYDFDIRCSCTSNTTRTSFGTALMIGIPVSFVNSYLINLIPYTSALEEIRYFIRYYYYHLQDLLDYKFHYLTNTNTSFDCYEKIHFFFNVFVVFIVNALYYIFFSVN